MVQEALAQGSRRLFRRVVCVSSDVCPSQMLHGAGIVTLWLFNIAMENGPCIDGLPIKNDDFPWLC